jgi:hypothetical protein
LSLEQLVAQAIQDGQVWVEDYCVANGPVDPLDPCGVFDLEYGGVVRILEHQLLGGMSGSEARRIVSETPDIAAAVTAGVAVGLVRVLGLWKIPDEIELVIRRIAARTEARDRQIEQQRARARVRIRRNLTDPDGPFRGRYVLRRDDEES